jgi:hypothetical protein
VPERGSLEQRMRDSRWLVAAEFAIVAAVFLADIYHHIYISKTPYLFLLGFAAPAGDEMERCWIRASAQLA